MWNAWRQEVINGEKKYFMKKMFFMLLHDYQTDMQFAW